MRRSGRQARGRLSASEAEYGPLAGDAFEGVDAPFVEREVRPGDEVGDGAGDEDLPRGVVPLAGRQRAISMTMDHLPLAVLAPIHMCHPDPARTHGSSVERDE